MTFFTPTDAFLDWISARFKFLIEVGAGEGVCARALRARGVKVLALDLYPEGLGVIFADGTTFPFPERGVVLVCRPCHGEFVPRLMENVERSKSRLVYVGLAKNFEQDLGEGHPEPIEALIAGEEGEQIIMIDYRTNEELLLQLRSTSTAQRYKEGPCWFIVKGEWLINMNGGRQPASDEDRVFAEQRVRANALDWQALDWSHSCYSPVPDALYGWLNRVGEFFGCSYSGHDALAHFFLKKTCTQLEEDGWVRVDGAGVAGMMTFRVRTKLSPEQRAWLLAKGHDLAPNGRDVNERMEDFLTPAERDRREAEAALVKVRERAREQGVPRAAREGD